MVQNGNAEERPDNAADPACKCRTAHDRGGDGLQRILGVVKKNRYRGFGPDHEGGPPRLTGRGCKPHLPVKEDLDLVGVPLLVLGGIGLVTPLQPRNMR